MGKKFDGDMSTLALGREEGCPEPKMIKQDHKDGFGGNLTGGRDKTEDWQSLSGPEHETSRPWGRRGQPSRRPSKAEMTK